MLKQISLLTGLQLKSLYNINVFHYTKDKKKKSRIGVLFGCYAFLIAVAFFYVGGLVYAYIRFGLADVIPAYLIMLGSVLVLLTASFKTGAVLFQKNAHDILCSLPIKESAIVTSRMIRLYLESLLMAFIMMFPGIAVYGFMVKPSALFYVISLLAVLSVPLIPMVIAVVVGGIITAIAARSKEKSLVSTALALVVVLGMIFLSFLIPKEDMKITAELLQNIDEIISGAIGSIFPPAIWLGNAMCDGNMLTALLVLFAEVLVFAFAAWVLSRSYKNICERLFSTTAAHDYEMEQLKSSSALEALYKKEFARYFSSSVYVVNTIIGPIMSVAFSAMVLFLGVDGIQEKIGIPVSIDRFLPFILGVICSIMPPSSAAISLEGKEWWIVKTLPIPTRVLLNSKLLLSISLIAPFYIVSELLLTIALKSFGFSLLWQLLIPALMILLCVTFGLFVNLKLPVFDWENEAAVVKQSAATLIGGMGGCLVVIVLSVVVFLVPMAYVNAIKCGFCVILAILTLLFYRLSCKVRMP